METIGVIFIDPWFVLDNESLLKNLLYFDKLVYNLGKRQLLENFCSSLPDGRSKFQSKMHEIDELTNAGLISHYSSNEAALDYKKYGNETSEEYALKSAELIKGFSTDKEFNELIVDFFERFREFGEWRSRNYASLLNNKYSNDYTPIIRTNNYGSAIKLNTSPSTVLKIVLKKFPKLIGVSNIKNIIEFKSDPQTQLKLHRLKDWVLETSKSSYSEKEIEQKLDFLLHEYTAQLEIHKLKYNIGIAETIVTTSLEIIENLVQLKFSTAAKTLFALTKEKANLLDDEMNTVGKEIAFIHQVSNDNRIKL